VLGRLSVLEIKVAVPESKRFRTPKQKNRTWNQNYRTWGQIAIAQIAEVIGLIQERGFPDSLIQILDSFQQQLVPITTAHVF
jgi:hypothetical protein